MLRMDSLLGSQIIYCQAETKKQLASIPATRLDVEMRRRVDELRAA